MEGCDNTCASELQNFAQTGLKPDEDLLAHGKEFAQKVFTLLQSKSRYSLGRVIIGGSVGKSTAIKQIFDFDCVIFINNGKYPPFTGILDELEDILLCCGRDDIVDIKTTAHSVQFKCPATEFEYDLLPATNFVQQGGISGEALINLQRERTLAAISMAPKYSNAFSSSLVESQVQFMKAQSAFVHELVRLCKFWNKTIYIEEYVSGRSTIVELIAVHVGQQVEEVGGRSLILRGFTAFLKSVQNLPHLDITFDGANPAMPIKPPILLEPANPYNNLLSTLGRNEMQILFTSASQTLARLKHFDSLKELFEAQPNTDGMFAFELQPRIFVGRGTGLVKKSMVVHNKEVESDNWTIQRLKALVDTYVLTDVIAITNQGQQRSPVPSPVSTDPDDMTIKNFTGYLKDHLFDKVTKLVYGRKTMSKPVPNPEEDVEFIIPYEKEGLDLFVTVGFRFIKT